MFLLVSESQFPSVLLQDTVSVSQVDHVGDLHLVKSHCETQTDMQVKYYATKLKLDNTLV